MSTFCLDLQASAAVSAPLELDSDCMEPRDGAAAQEPGGVQGHQLRRTGSGGLGVALEEELAMLTGQRDDEDDLSGLEAPAAAQNSELLSLFRQKEKDLVLAAKLGKALLERNQDLTKQYEKMHKDLNDKLEHLEQEKHELRRRLESREGEWEGRVAELETDVQHLQGELERHQVQLREADRDKTKAISELSEQNHRLLEQLSRAAEVERQLSTQVHSLRDDFREKSLSTSQHMTRLETLQAEIQMLSERKMELERRVHAMLEENELLQNTVDDLREKTMLLERQCHEKDLQLRQSQLELQEVQVSHRQLTARLEEVTEERSLHGLTPHPSSLLCEIEQSMEQEEQEQEREQLRLQLWEAYCEVRSLCSHLRGNDVTDSALSTDSSMDESSETSSAKDVPTGSIHTSLLELRRLTQNLLDGNESTGSRRSDEEALEEQVRKLGEELRDLREMYEAGQDKSHCSEEEVLRLHNQIALLSVEMCSLREDNERMKTMAEIREPSEQLQSAIRDRDEAIAKKKAVEMELAKCKIDIMSLNSQLLDAIQQKLNLSQQLEAWQWPFLSFRTTLSPPWFPPSFPAVEDDMHRVIDQQLMDKYQDEWRSAPSSLSGSSKPHGGQTSRRAHRVSDRDKKLFSFFKKN
ncbi:BICD family-like cargo adapter 1 isoform X2 [Takifugu rubripes]|uniref:BICD family-like cargo adapter 1 isoform X2 n=1 Tax=Takifugu rubripes TaxID=31033 RepID=UPI00114589C8|nr:BICD family-like cargo adapter 1 isoform X2 [Takifugu rubripes]XP_056887787.1 BICD family-like cargo adapter 1 isoform X3 [Takifugu flavidus]